MDRDMSDRIRQRAYEIWLATGRREGEAEQHWLTAERELSAASSLPEPTTAGQARPATRRSKRAKLIAKAPQPERCLS
jgi:hypothetical protein